MDSSLDSWLRLSVIGKRPPNGIRICSTARRNGATVASNARGVSPMVMSDIDNLDHDPKLAHAFGQMVVAWAHAETLLVNVFAAATGNDHNRVIAAYYRIPTFESRVKVIRAFLAEWETQEFDRDEIARAVDRLSRLSKTRNGWVHGVWCLTHSKRETVILDYRAQDGTEDISRPVKAADVLNHVAAVRLRTKELTDLIPLPYWTEKSSQ